MTEFPDIHLPPHSPEIERAVLGAVIGVDGAECLATAIELGWSEDWFYVEKYRRVWQAVNKLQARNAIVDIATVADNVNGQADMLSGILDDGCIPPYLEHHLKELQKYWRLRELAAIGRRLERQAHYEDADPDELQSKAESAVNQLFRAGGDKPPDKRQVLEEIMEMWDAAQRNGHIGHSTGFQSVDKLFCLQPQGLYIVSGRPGLGKTTLVRNWLEYNAADCGIPSAMSSMEQSTHMILAASLARRARVSMWALNRGKLTPGTIQRVGEHVATLADWPIYVDDRLKTPSQLFSWARRWVSKYGVKIIAVDFLQKIPPDNKRLSKAQQVSEASGTLAAIAKELRIVVIAISSLSNEGNLKESGDIEYDCWAELRLRKHDKWSQQNQLLIAECRKNRFGPTGACELRLDGNREEIIDEGDAEE